MAISAITSGPRAGCTVPANRRRALRSVAPLLLCAVAFEGSACAMRPADSKTIACSIENGDKLPPALRADGAVCGPITRSTLAAAEQSGISSQAVAIKVKAVTPYLLAVTLSVDGATLPEQKLGSSDRALTPSAIDRLAAGLARQLTIFAATRR